MEYIDAIITGIFTIFGVFIGTKSSKKSSKEENEKNIVANLISSSRMEWIQDVRRHSADYVSVIEDFHNFKIRKYYDKEGKGFNFDFENQFDRAEAKVNKHKNILLLNFGMDPGNDKIIELINELADMKPHKEVTFKDGAKGFAHETFFKESNEKMDEFIKEMRLYLNKQWRRAKSLEKGNIDPQELEGKR